MSIRRVTRSRLLAWLMPHGYVYGRDDYLWAGSDHPTIIVGDHEAMLHVRVDESDDSLDVVRIIAAPNDSDDHLWQAIGRALAKVDMAEVRRFYANVHAPDQPQED